MDERHRSDTSASQAELSSLLESQLEQERVAGSAETALAAASTAAQLAAAAMERGDKKESQEKWTLAAGLVQPWVEKAAGNKAVLELHAAANTELGDFWFDAGQLRQAETCYRAALSSREALVAEPSDGEGQRKRIDALTNVADVLLERDAHAEAAALFRKAIETTTLLSCNDQSPRLLFDLAMLYNGLGDALDGLHATEEAAECWENALSLANRLTRRVEAGDADWHLLAQCLYRMSYLHADLQDEETARELLARWKSALAMLPRDLRSDFEEEYNRLAKAMGQGGRR